MSSHAGKRNPMLGCLLATSVNPEKSSCSSSVTSTSMSGPSLLEALYVVIRSYEAYRSHWRRAVLWQPTPPTTSHELPLNPPQIRHRCAHQLPVAQLERLPTHRDRPIVQGTTDSQHADVFLQALVAVATGGKRMAAHIHCDSPIGWSGRLPLPRRM